MTEMVLFFHGCSQAKAPLLWLFGLSTEENRRMAAYAPSFISAFLFFSLCLSPRSLRVPVPLNHAYPGTAAPALNGGSYRTLTYTVFLVA